MYINKLQRFAENKTFRNVIEIGYLSVLNDDFYLKNKWQNNFFKNNYKIVLELACGKGEYSLALAQKYQEKNFIGIDIKGSRIWRGAKTAIEQNIQNLAFIRSNIEFIDKIFAKNEVDEIWITFPDPQLKKENKRITSPVFIEKYKNILSVNGVVNLKTDSQELYDYTKKVIKEQGYEILEDIDDIYGQDEVREELSIKTHYEKFFLERGKKIKYIQFKITK